MVLVTRRICLLLCSTTCPITSNTQKKIPRNQIIAYQRANKRLFQFFRNQSPFPAIEPVREAFGSLSSRQGRQMNLGHGWCLVTGAGVCVAVVFLVLYHHPCPHRPRDREKRVTVAHTQRERTAPAQGLSTSPHTFLYVLCAPNHPRNPLKDPTYII